MSTHTPGPWLVRGRGLISVNTKADKSIVAEVITNGTRSETKSNARLIAAAPDMLAALQEIADGLADTRSTPGQHMTLIPKARACEIARAAIARASDAKAAP
jgi:hypothetical protein